MASTLPTSVAGVSSASAGVIFRRSAIAASAPLASSVTAMFEALTCSSMSP